ncbi:uncharacterized protein bcl2l12 [Stigmatopora nigra]
MISTLGTFRYRRASSPAHLSKLGNPTTQKVMSMIRSSSVSSISLLEVKAETRLVLQAFLKQTLSVPFVQRPGRVGGAYKDHNKLSASVKPNTKNGLDPQVEDPNSADEKKTGFRDLLKQLPLRSTRSSAKSSSLEKDTKPKVPNIKALSEEDLLSPSSTSEEDDAEKKTKKRNKKKLTKKISQFFKKRDRKEKEKEDHDLEERKGEAKEDNSQPQRPSALLIDETAEPRPTLVSPNHPPEFYRDVAYRLRNIAENRLPSTKKLTPTPPQFAPDSLSSIGDVLPPSTKKLTSPTSPPTPSDFLKKIADSVKIIGDVHPPNTRKLTPPTPPPTPSPPTPPPTPSAVDDKELVVQQLVQVLSVEADSINNKIQLDPFLRSSLARLSYPSFARLLDTVSSTWVPDAPLLPPAESPTLRRMAVSMEVSKRIVTATGVHRMQGYAECYMETFTPWLKSRGGWENVVDVKDPDEYD